MKINDVKLIIQELAQEEFSSYPGSYPLENGTYTLCCVENISQWAMNMWDSREDDEIARDFRLGLHTDTYIAWAFEAFKKIY